MALFISTIIHISGIHFSFMPFMLLRTLDPYLLAFKIVKLIGIDLNLFIKYSSL